MQGAADRYGTLAQVRVAQEECYCPVDALVLAGVGHAPHREKPEETPADDRGVRRPDLPRHDEGVENAA